VEVNGENFETCGVGKPQREIDPFRDELAALRNTLGIRIREFRKAKGWSQEQFAAFAHVHRTFAGALERGEKNLSFHALVLIARCFGVTVGELLAGIETGESPRTRRKAGQSDLDRSRILLELAAAERSIQLAREIASPPTGRSPSSATKRSKP
jgi:transcriptional regulator with XRE-family HTH domain